MIPQGNPRIAKLYRLISKKKKQTNKQNPKHQSAPRH